jgi:hypothetical protein
MTYFVSYLYIKKKPPSIMNRLENQCLFVRPDGNQCRKLKVIGLPYCSVHRKFIPAEDQSQIMMYNTDQKLTAVQDAIKEVPPTIESLDLDAEYKKVFDKENTKRNDELKKWNDILAAYTPRPKGWQPKPDTSTEDFARFQAMEETAKQAKLNRKTVLQSKYDEQRRRIVGARFEHLRRQAIELLKEEE